MVPEGDYEPSLVRSRLVDPASDASSTAAAPYAGCIDLRAGYGADYLTDLVNGMQQAPTASCWGNSADTDAFRLGGRVYRQAALFRAEEFTRAADGPVHCSGPDVYAIDSDMFLPGGV